ncbi:helix-turn-helix domain-containing protein [Phyllobacterium zundukense]
MTQQQLATPIGVSSVQIQKYERGENRIAVATLVHLCKALNLSPMDFLGPYFEAMEPTDSADSQTTETAKHVEHPSSPQHKLREGRGTRHWLKKPRRR